MEIYEGVLDVLIGGPVVAGGAVVSVARDDGSEIVIHAMRMRGSYEPFLRGKEEAGD